MAFAESTFLTVLALVLALLFSTSTYLPGADSSRDIGVTILIVFAIVVNIPRVIAMAWPVEKNNQAPVMRRTEEDSENPYRPPENY